MPIEFGVNGHPFWSHGGVPVTRQLDLIKQAGLKSYRVDLDNADAGSMNLLRTLVTEGAARDIDILPIINLHPERYASEAAAYNAGKAIATAYAKAFPGMTWELGNEYDNMAIKPGTSGALPLHYDDAKYAVNRGLINGMYDGAKGADPTAKTVVDNAGWHHYGFLQRLAADGVKWDITGTHWYSDQGSITNVGGGGVNSLEILARFNKPIWVTEFNARPGSMGEQAEAQWLTKTMADWDALASKYNVQAAHIYELLDQPEMGSSPEARYGLYTATGTYKASGTAVDQYLDTVQPAPDPVPVPDPTPDPTPDPSPVPPADADFTLSFSAQPTKTINGGWRNDTIHGTSGHDGIDGKGGIDTMTGRLGDDSYWLDTKADRVVERAGEGSDTIYTFATDRHTLPANVETMVYMGSGNARIGGNSGDNIVNVGPGHDTVNGGPGRDEVRGRGGNDTFVVEKGEAKDVIVDFQGGAGAGDRLKLVGFGFDDFADVKPLIVQDGNGSTLVLPNSESVHFRGVAAGTLAADDFAFAPAATTGDGWYW